jgi:hypothetical protein
MAGTPPLDDVDLIEGSITSEDSDEGAEPIQDGLPLQHLASVALPLHDNLRSQSATAEGEHECPAVVRHAFNATRLRGSYAVFKYMQLSITISALNRDLTPQHWDAACSFVDSYVSQGKISRERGGRQARLHFQGVCVCV